MFKTVLITAAALASLSATPSIGAPASNVGGLLEGASVAAQTMPSNSTQRSDVTRYCTIYTSTGSHIPHKECHTRKDWIDLTGADPLSKN
jgi:hypothetical protein